MRIFRRLRAHQRSGATEEALGKHAHKREREEGRCVPGHLALLCPRLLNERRERTQSGLCLGEKEPSPPRLPPITQSLQNGNMMRNKTD